MGTLLGLYREPTLAHWNPTGTILGPYRVIPSNWTQISFFVCASKVCHFFSIFTELEFQRALLRWAWNDAKNASSQAIVGLLLSKFSTPCYCCMKITGGHAFLFGFERKKEVPNRRGTPQCGAMKRNEWGKKYLFEQVLLSCFFSFFTATHSFQSEFNWAVFHVVYVKSFPTFSTEWYEDTIKKYPTLSNWQKPIIF